MSEFVMLYRMTDKALKEEHSSAEKSQNTLKKWRTWLKGLEDKGHLKSIGQPLGPTGKVVVGKKKTVMDGPYAETKDIVGGFSIIEARDADHAAQLASGCPGLDAGGMVEVRPIMQLHP